MAESRIKTIYVEKKTWLVTKIIAAGVSYGFILVMFILNYRFAGGSWALNCLLFFFGIVTMLGTAHRIVGETVDMDEDEAIAFFEKLKANRNGK